MTGNEEADGGGVTPVEVSRGSPLARTMVYVHGAPALPTKLNDAPLHTLLRTNLQYRR